MSNQDSVREARLFGHELQGLLHFVDFIQTPAADRAADWPTSIEAAEWLLNGIAELERAIRQGRSKSIRPADEREVKEWIVKLLTAAKGIKRDVTEGKDFRPRLAKFRALAADGADLVDAVLDCQEVPRPPLGDLAARIYEMLLALPLHRALTTPQILDALDESGLRALARTNKDLDRPLKELRAYGVKNERKIGYFIPAENRPG